MYGVIYIPTLYVDVLVLRRIKQKLMSPFSIMDMGQMSLLPAMGVTRDREKGTVTITMEKCTKSLLERYGMASCSSMYTPGVGKKAVAGPAGGEALK